MGFNPFLDSNGGGGGGSSYSISKIVDQQTGYVSYVLTGDGASVGDTIVFDGDGVPVTDPSYTGSGTQELSLNECLDMIYQRADASYNFTTFTELNIDTYGKTLKQITDALLAKNLPQNTIVTGQIYGTAAPFDGNAECEVLINQPALWWTCKSLNVSPYSWNAITASSTWGDQGIVLNWVPSQGFIPNTTQQNAIDSGITSALVTQIGTNKSAIEGQQNATTDTVAGNGYAIINGIRLYVSSTAPTGTIPDGSVGVGW